VNRPVASPVYRHTQIGWRIIAASVLGIIVAVGLSFTLSPATRAAAPWLLACLYGILALALALFATLTVVVDDATIAVRFGVGILRKSIAIADVLKCDLVRTRVLWGWGLHWTPAGWLYNVGGRDAVRLELAGQRPVIVGSDQAPLLRDAIEARRQRQ
jgi:hypothetical protein